jgi:hypothetical protein
VIRGNAERIRYYFMATLRSGSLLSFTIGQGIHTLILGMTCMTLHPLPGDRPANYGSIHLLP